MAAYANCQLCSDICDSPKVYFRGSVPSDLVFIGEAPGRSERALRKPFVGSSGTVLEGWIQEATRMSNSLPEKPLRYSVVNTILCYPKDERISKFREPTDEELTNCLPRLEEYLEIAEPKALVYIGSVARSIANKIRKKFKLPERSILHPAYTLRNGYGPKHLTCKKQIVKIVTLLQEIGYGKEKET